MSKDTMGSLSPGVGYGDLYANRDAYSIEEVDESADFNQEVKDLVAAGFRLQKALKVRVRVRCSSSAAGAAFAGVAGREARRTSFPFISAVSISQEAWSLQRGLRQRHRCLSSSPTPACDHLRRHLRPRSVQPAPSSEREPPPLLQNGWRGAPRFRFEKTREMRRM